MLSASLFLLPACAVRFANWHSRPSGGPEVIPLQAKGETEQFAAHYLSDSHQLEWNPPV
jgi:hypothetical protein